jgi:hypothetical protein
MGPRYCQITKNDGLLEKVGTNLLGCTAQHRSFKIDYHLTEFIIYKVVRPSTVTYTCSLLIHIYPLHVSALRPSSE